VPATIGTRFGPLTPVANGSSEIFLLAT
jgi:hypothetical protein